MVRIMTYDLHQHIRRARISHATGGQPTQRYSVLTLERLNAVAFQRYLELSLVVFSRYNVETPQRSSYKTFRRYAALPFQPHSA